MRDDGRICAGFGARAAAYAVDRALLLVALGAVRTPMAVASFVGGGQLTAGDFLFGYSFLDVLCYLLSTVYFVMLTYFTGGTLGKKLMHIRVENADGEELAFIDVLYRETVGRFLSGVMLAGYIMALVDRRRRAFHDWLCQTRVVYDLERSAPAPASEPVPAQVRAISAERPAEADDGGCSMSGETPEKEG